MTARPNPWSDVSMHTISSICPDDHMATSLGTSRAEIYGGQWQQQLPPELQLAICRDALLTHIWQRQQEQIQWWIEPIFDTWRKIVHYERQWPGSTEPDRPSHPSVCWDP